MLAPSAGIPAIDETTTLDGPGCNLGKTCLVAPARSSRTLFEASASRRTFEATDSPCRVVQTAGMSDGSYAGPAPKHAARADLSRSVLLPWLGRPPPWPQGGHPLQPILHGRVIVPMSPSGLPHYRSGSSHCRRASGGQNGSIHPAVEPPSGRIRRRLVLQPPG